MKRTLMAVLAAGTLWSVCVAAEPAPVPPTRDEVTAFVEKAAAFAAANGKDKAIAEFNKRDGAFFKGELYIYAYDMKGICLAHPVLPDRVGQDCSKDKDTHGIAVQDECLKIFAKSDAGWIKCTWINPATKKLEPKALYVKKISPEWYLGSGTYGAEAEK